LSTSALASAVEYLAGCQVGAVRLHAARSLSSPRRFGPIRALRDEAERDMFARDVHELFLLPYVEALRTGRLRGEASGLLGRVLSSNGQVAVDALLARGCFRPGKPLQFLLDNLLERAHPRGFFYEPFHSRGLSNGEAREDGCYQHVTAVYTRYLVAFGRGADARVRRALDWLVAKQQPDGAWRPPPEPPCPDQTGSYVLTRAVAQAFAEMPASLARRYATARRKLACGWSDRILVRCAHPDAVLTEPNIAEDPAGAPNGNRLRVPTELRDRILYFPLEDLWLALAIGATPKHPNLAPWVQWLSHTQLADGSWRLRNPSLRERLLLSDPNGRLRAEALYLTDEWITLRGAQILHLAEKRARERFPESVPT
jgi:hypothetical protein